MNKLTDDIRRTVRGEQAGGFSVPRCMAWLACYEQALATAERELAEARASKDGAYHERDQCVALIARMALSLGYRAGLGRHTGEVWDDDWRNIVFINLPAGQVSWHIHDSELPLFDFLGEYLGPWDGHTTPEKYARCAQPVPNATLAAADTTRREWEVRAATSYAAGRAAGLREAAEMLTREAALWSDEPATAARCRLHAAAVLALAPPADAAGLSADDAIHTCAMGESAAETVRSETIFNCRTCPASTPGWTDGRFGSLGWKRIDHIDGPSAICPVCAADPTALDGLREEYPNAAIAAEPRDEGEVSGE